MQSLNMDLACCTDIELECGVLEVEHHPQHRPRGICLMNTLFKTLVKLLVSVCYFNQQNNGSGNEVKSGIFTVFDLNIKWQWLTAITNTHFKC